MITALDSLSGSGRVFGLLGVNLGSGVGLSWGSVVSGVIWLG